MLTRIIRHPTGLLHKIWRKAERLPVPLKPEPLENTTPPLWPYRYQGIGISLCSLDTPMTTPTPTESGAEIPKA